MTEEQVDKHWHFWNTLLFSLVIFISYVILQVALGILFYIGYSLVVLGVEGFQKRMEMSSLFPDLMTLPPFAEGLSLVFTTALSAFICIKLTLKIARRHLSQEQMNIFFGFQWPPARQIKLWLGISLPALIVVDLFFYVIQYPIPPFMIEIGHLAMVMPLVYIAVIIIPPLFEEILFRGFLLEGLRQSPFKDTGAVFFSSFLFAIVHTQYSDVYLLLIFGVGLLLAYARLKTNSLYLSMLMHGIYNGISMLEITLYLSFA